MTVCEQYSCPGSYLNLLYSSIGILLCYEGAGPFPIVAPPICGGGLYIRAVN